MSHKKLLEAISKGLPEKGVQSSTTTAHEKFYTHGFNTALDRVDKEVIAKEVLGLVREFVPKERRCVHTVILKGSQEDLNDTYRKGYNKCRRDIIDHLDELLNDK